MNLDELIEALQDLKKSGKAIDKLPCFFVTRRRDRQINQVKIKPQAVGGTTLQIELSE